MATDLHKLHVSLLEIALKELLEFFKGDEMGEEFDRAKLAQATISAVGRLRATERVRDATQFHIVRALAEDQGELQDYIRTTLPHLTPAQMLAGKKK